MDAPLARTPANFGCKSCFSASSSPSTSCIPNLKLLASTVVEISRGSQFFLDAPLVQTPANFGPKIYFLVSYSPSPTCIPNLKLLFSSFISLLWLSTVIEIRACLPVGGATSSACRRQWLLGLQACARSLVFLLPRC